MMECVEGLKVESLRIDFGRLKIQAGFVVRPGERVLLSGPSGSGKTSVLRWLAGFQVPGVCQGRLGLNGRDLTHASPERRELGVLTQESVIFPGLTVFENAALGLAVRGVSRKEQEAQVRPWLERCGLSQAAKQSASVLSGGERQRLALVRAWCWKPQALLLDEPFSALDPALRREMGEWLVELHRQHPVPLVLITHDPEEASRLGTRELVMKVPMPGIHVWD
ncbi:MAG: sulfate transporter, ATP-binding protein [Pseudomonadota bacterium]|jgi:ABC-type sulfate/molybdate transport systems ATPase subunit